MNPYVQDVKFQCAARKWFLCGQSQRAWFDKAAERLIEYQRREGDCPGVYAIRSGQFVKIGRAATSMRRRLRALQTGAPNELEFIAVLSFDPYHEKRCQARLSSFHVRGEWYALNDQSIREIATMAIECGWAASEVLA